jgi:hypothetical protein
MLGLLIRPTGNFHYGIHNFRVVPASGELGLTGSPGSMPVAASRVVTVEYVRSALGRYANPVRRRPVSGFYLLPAATLISFVLFLVVGGPHHLAVLRTSPPFRGPNRFGRLGWPSRNIATGSFRPGFPLTPAIGRSYRITRPI